MSTMPTQVFIVMLKGKPQVVYAREEDAEGWKIANNQPKAEIVPEWLMSHAGWVTSPTWEEKKAEYYKKHGGEPSA